MENHDLTKIFAEAGDAVKQRWEQTGFSHDAFPAIAEHALRDDAPLTRVSADDLYRWVLTAGELPVQHDRKARFAQPPITVYYDDRFHVAFLFWTTSTTTIHEHSFDGAFRVHLGSSLQTTYGFNEQQRWGDDLRRGQLGLQSVELLLTGDVCAIQCGSRYIHSVYHLDHPSITLIIRTNVRADQSTPQYNYEFPGFALNPFLRDERTDRAKQTLSHLHRIGHPHFMDFVREALDSASAHGAYLILGHVKVLCSEAELSGLFPRLGERFGDGFSELLPGMIHEKSRTGRLVHARQTVKDPEGRFLLALLLNVADKDQFMALLSRRFPGDDPQAIVSRWVTRLLELRGLGIDASSFSGMLVRGLLGGLSAEEVIRKLMPILRTDEAVRTVKAQAAELIFLFRPIFDATSGDNPPPKRGQELENSSPWRNAGAAGEFVTS